MTSPEIFMEDPRCYELVGPLSTLGGAETHPPGSVRRYPDGSAVLQLGYGRWLLVGHAVQRESETVAAMRAAGGSLIDVSAKWLRLRVTGVDAQSYLSQFLSVARVLHDRDCAPVSILDCPTLLARCEGGFELWVTRSWATWLRDSLNGIWLRSFATIRPGG